MPDFQPLPGLSVTVDQVQYDPTRPAPPDRPHPFGYQLTIHNGSEEPVDIFGRKWIVRDDSGQTMVVEGDGVVGKFPHIEPGQSFSYNSYHIVRNDSVASGAFFGTAGEGRPIRVGIPSFEMHPPMMA